jgi:hypothetical protein
LSVSQKGELPEKAKQRDFIEFFLSAAKNKQKSFSIELN